MPKIPAFEQIFSLESLFDSWREFSKGKKTKTDVAHYSMRLSDNLISLALNLKNGQYHHRGYHFFKISDPKPRDIHKASVNDRIVHHALYRAFYPYFDTIFINNSYSCRINKGTHRALEQFKKMSREASFNHTKTLWALKCDIKKCFGSVNHQVLKNILLEHIKCPRTLVVINEIIDSFHREGGIGIPLGNLTSQLFINIYINPFDHFVKRKLKIKKYIRYADDMVFMSQDKEYLERQLPSIREFLWQQLKLELHPNKILIGTLASGVDFLGRIFFPDHIILRTATKKRMFRLLAKMNFLSYTSLLKYGNSWKLRNQISDTIDSWKEHT